MKSHYKILIASLLLAISAYIIGLWLYVALIKLKSYDFQRAFKEYLQYFPAGLQKGRLLMIISATCSFTTLLLLSWARRTAGTLSLILFSGLLLLVSLFSLL